MASTEGGAVHQVPGSCSALPPGRHLRSGGPRDSPIHARPVGRPDGRSAATAGRCPEGRAPRLPGAACRRDASGHARPRRRQDPPGLPVVLQHRCPRSGAGGDLRLCRQPRRQARPGLPRRLAGHPRLRRLRGLQSLDRQRRDGSRLHGPRPAQVLRASGTRAEPDRRRGARADRCPLRRGGSCAGPEGRSPPGAARNAGEAAAGRLESLAAGVPGKDSQRVIQREGHRLHPEALGSAHPLPDRRARADRQQLDREPDPADCHRPQELALCRVAARWQTGCGDHEPDPVGAPQRARALRLSEGCPHPPADAAAESDRGVAAASVATG